jgi:hypothetical protein
LLSFGEVCFEGDKLSLTAFPELLLASCRAGYRFDEQIRAVTLTPT